VAIGTILLSNIGAHFISLAGQMPLKLAQSDHCDGFHQQKLQHPYDKKYLPEAANLDPSPAWLGHNAAYSAVLHIVSNTI
jgi:hypothetical protein